MTVQLAPTPVFKAFDNNGNPLANGQLGTFQAGTSTPQATWVDSTQTTQNTNPVILSARGECNLWLDTALSYKLVLKDLLGNQIWSVDNIQGLAIFLNNFLPTLLTQNYLSTILYPQTAAELAAGVTPTSFLYQAGNVLRYGADPTGAADSQPAFVAACLSNNFVWIPSGNYTVNSQINVDRGHITIQGENQSNEIGGVNQGGVLIQYVNSSSNTACFSWGGTANKYQAINISRIGIQLPSTSHQQIGLRFSQALGVRIRDLVITGVGTTADTSVGIQLDGLIGPFGFTGDFDIENCYITNHLIGINVQGTVTTLRITDNEMYGTGGHATNIGILFGDPSVNTFVSTPIVRGNTFDQWHTGVQSYGVAIRQIANYFEACDSSVMGGNYAITGITQAASAVVTSSAAVSNNPFLPGNAIDFSGISGMTQINGLTGVITANGGAAGAWTATVAINSSAFSAYTSGGTAATARNWNWIRGANASDIENTSLYDTIISGTTNFPHNATDKCAFYGPATIYTDVAVIQSGAGFRELQRTVNLGYFTTPAFSAGNFTASGSMTWAPPSNTIVTYEYTVVGKAMTVNWFISGTTNQLAGTASTAMQIAIPASFIANKRAAGTCVVVNNAVTTIGSWQVAASGNVIQIYKDGTQTANYTVGGVQGDTWGSATFEVQ